MSSKTVTIASCFLGSERPNRPASSQRMSHCRQRGAEGVSVPLIDELLARLRNGRVFAAVDQCRGYHQFPVFRPHQKYCGLITNEGTWVWTRCIMGTLNAAGHYAHIMRGVLDGSSDPTEGPPDMPHPAREYDETDPDVIKRRINLFERNVVAYVDESLMAGAGEALTDAETNCSKRWRFISIDATCST